MPLQSGSDAVLKAMRRSYRRDRYLGHPRPGPRRDARRRDHDRHHRRIPRRDRGRLPADPRRRPRGAVQRSVHVPLLASAPAPPPRRWTTSCRTRSCRSATSASSTWSTRSPGSENQTSRRSPTSRSWSPRARVARTSPTDAAVRPCPRQPARALHAADPTAASCARATWSTVEVTYAAPHHLVGDGPRHVGSAYPGRRRLGAAHVGTHPAAGVSLGMPSVGVPDPLPSLDVPACSAPDPPPLARGVCLVSHPGAWLARQICLANGVFAWLTRQTPAGGRAGWAHEPSRRVRRELARHEPYAVLAGRPGTAAAARQPRPARPRPTSPSSAAATRASGPR